MIRLVKQEAAVCMVGIQRLKVAFRNKDNNNHIKILRKEKN